MLSSCYSNNETRMREHRVQVARLPVVDCGALDGLEPKAITKRLWIEHHMQCASGHRITHQTAKTASPGRDETPRLSA